mgnify:CR=1 FL=1
MVATLHAVAAPKMREGVKVVTNHPYMYQDVGGAEIEEAWVFAPISKHYYYNDVTEEIELRTD